MKLFFVRGFGAWEWDTVCAGHVLADTPNEAIETFKRLQEANPHTDKLLFARLTFKAKRSKADTSNAINT